MVSEIAASRQPGIRANLAAIMNFRCFRTSKVVTSGTGNKFFKSGEKSETAEDSGKQPKPPIIAAIPKRIGKEVSPKYESGNKGLHIQINIICFGDFFVSMSAAILFKVSGIATGRPGGAGITIS